MLTWTRPALLLAAAALVATACAPGAGAAREEAAARAAPAPRTPTFAPEDETATPTPPPPERAEEAEEDVEPSAGTPPPAQREDVPDEPSAPDEPGTTTDGDRNEPRETPRPEPAPSPPAVSTVTDPSDDTSPPALGGAPASADLVGGEVHSTDAEITLTVDLAAAPEAEDGTALNVASFHDLTGDGYVDLEVWANHGEGGWYPSWRDNREGRAAFGPRSGVVVDADGARLTLTFPSDLVGGATSWRWALGLEWGRYEWLGTAAAARDAAPDDGLVSHPG